MVVSFWVISGRTGHSEKNTRYRPENENRPVKSTEKKKKKKKNQTLQSLPLFWQRRLFARSSSISSLSLVFLLHHLSSKLAPLLLFFLLTDFYFNFLGFLFLSNKRQLNIYYLIVNVDSSDVVKLFSSSSSSNRLTWPLVAECRDILQVFRQVQLSHYYREANHATDILAKIGSSQREDFVYYVTPSFSLLDVLAFDCVSDNAPNIFVNSEVAVSFDTHSLAGQFVIDSWFNKKKSVKVCPDTTHVNLDDLNFKQIFIFF